MKKERATLLSTRQTWISLEIIILFILVVVYTVIVWQYEGAKSQETMEAVFATIRHVSAFILLAIVFIVGIFEIGGEIMIRFTSLMQKARDEGIAQGKAEGKAEGKVEGKAEVYREWYADWERRRESAEAKGISFNEPPPPKPENYPEE